MTRIQPSQSSVKSAMRTLDVIEYVVVRPAGVVAQEIAASLDIPVSSLSYLLATLVDRGYLRREGRRYRPGPGLDRLRAAPEHRSIVDRARPLVRALRSKLNETASLFLPNGWMLEAAVTETAEQTLRYSIDVGTKVPLHCVAAGKAILAALPDDEVERYLRESDRRRYTPRTIVDPGELRAQIATIREVGYAWTADEHTHGISGIGAALTEDGTPVAAISVAVPSSRFDAITRDKVVGQVLLTCHALGHGVAKS